MRTWVGKASLLIGTAMLAACGDSGGNSAASNDPAPSATASATPAAAGAIDACTFIPKAELEPLVGHELREGEPQDATPPMSACSFETPTGSATTRTFENPALPDAAGFSGVTVTTFATTAANFADSRKQMGAGSPDAPGVGEEAFFSGPAMIFVRKGDRGFSIRAYVEPPKTDGGKAKLSEVMTALGKAGAGKL